MTAITTERHTVTVRQRLGGVDTPAAIMGMFAGLGVLVFIGAALAIWAADLGYQLNAIDIEGNVQTLAAAGTVAALVVVFVSFMLGGWTAARMARFDGGINGIASAMWLLLLVAVFAALGAFVDPEMNLMQRAGLPDWFSQLRGDEVTAAAVIAAAAGVVTLFVGAYVGGRLGERHNRRIDADVAVTEQVTNRPVV